MLVDFSKYFSLLFLFIQCTYAYLEYDGWLNLELYHALSLEHPEVFSYRGNVTIPNLTDGSAIIKQEPLNSKEINDLIILAKLDAFYRLRILVTYPNKSIVGFLTSSKACALVNAELNDVLWVSIDSNGSVLGVTQTVSGGGGNCKNKSMQSNKFTTDVIIKHMELAPVPDTASFIQKLEREREARERGDVRDNRGFFAKYWMYIVPVVILVLISGATNPEANSAGGAGGR